MRTGAPAILVLTTLLLSAIHPSRVGADDGRKAATMATQISPSGLKFLGEQLKKLMTGMFLGMRLPDVLSLPSHPYLNTHDTYVHEFVAPDMIVRPVAHDRIDVEGTGGLVGIRGTYKTNYSYPFTFFDSAKGSFTFHTRNTTVLAELKPFIDLNDAPQLRLINCQVSIDQNEVVKDTSEDNPFSNELISKMYCEQFSNVVDKINEKLEKYHSGYTMAEDVTIQYNVINSVISGKDLSVLGYVDVVYDNKTCNMPSVPVDTKKGQPITREYMMTVWLSVSVFNCFLDGLYQNYHDKWMPLIGRDTPKLGAYLGTRCAKEEICIGNVMPGLEAFPHEFVNFYFFSAHPPRVEIKKASRDVLFSANLNVQMRLANTEKALVLMNVIINAKLEPYITNSRISAKIVESPSLNLTVTRSELGEKAMDSSIWQNLIDLFRPEMLAEVNARLVDGFPLPQLSTLPISDDYARISLQDDQMRIAFDLISTPTRYEGQLHTVPLQNYGNNSSIFHVHE